MDELRDLIGQPLTLHVGIGITERRLDKYLHGRFRNLSRHFLQDAIRAGAVTVNGKPAKPSFRLSPGDIIELVIPEPPSKDIEPEDIPLDILYEDGDIIVLNKPADQIVHPARGNTHGTLVNALAHYSEHLSSGLGEFRPGIVHRLDRDTTGVMVVTKHDAAQWQVAKQFELRQVKKTYLAIVHGTPELHADRISAPLGVHPTIREKYAIRPEIGKEAITYYEVLEAFRGFSFVKCEPHTGRTHLSPMTCTAASSSIAGNWPTPSRPSRSRSSPAVPCTPRPSNSPTPPPTNESNSKPPCPPICKPSSTSSANTARCDAGRIPSTHCNSPGSLKSSDDSDFMAFATRRTLIL
jgi:23S rRNA pseudouridine1911/1915/1917 synthase